MFPCDGSGGPELPPGVGSLQQPGLVNHLTFPTHEWGGSLDSVLSDLPETSILSQPLGPVGSSDGSWTTGRSQTDRGKLAAIMELIVAKMLKFYNVFID